MPERYRSEAYTDTCKAGRRQAERYVGRPKGRGKRMSEKVVICGANAYEKKFYFNKEFSKIPESIQEELHIICVLFTEEVGGIFTIGFSEDGEMEFETNCADDDFMYDEIAAGMLVAKIRNTKQELLQSLSLYYRVLFLHEDVSALLGEDDQ